jgi:hypothetical protein
MKEHAFYPPMAERQAGVGGCSVIEIDLIIPLSKKTCANKFAPTKNLIQQSLLVFPESS